MPLCRACRETYREHLTRCPYCGARTGEAVPAEPQFEVGNLPEAMQAGAQRPRRRSVIRLAAIVAGVGIALLAAVVFVLPDLLWPRDEEHDLARGVGAATPPPPPPVERERIEETFLVERVERWGDAVLVEGVCAPTAVTRVEVDGRRARIEPGGDRFRALVPYRVPRIAVVGIGLDDEHLAHEVEVPPPSVVGANAAPRIVSHADGSTLHASEAVVREMLANQPGAAWDRTVALDRVETLVTREPDPFRLYRLPEGFVAARVTAAGHLVVLRLRDRQEMVLIPAGVGYRGYGDDLPHGPRHVFSEEAFLIDRTEVTCAQYARFLAHAARVDDRIYRHVEDPGVTLRPIAWAGDQPPAGEAELPVRGVSWFAASAYARWVGGRLPRESEWERAAGGPDGLPYPWGEKFDPDRCRSQEDGPVAAASGLPGASPFGLLHTAGNVREWCEDRYDPRWLLRSSRTDPRGPARGHHRVVRGGSYASTLDALMVPYRDHAQPTPHADLHDVGFRVLCEFPEP